MTHCLVAKLRMMGIFFSNNILELNLNKENNFFLIKVLRQNVLKSLNKKNKKYLSLLFLIFLFLFLFFWTEPYFKESGTIKIWDRNHILLYQSAGVIGRKMPVSFNRFPDHLINATIAAEDPSFWSNIGVDLKAIIRSLLLNIKSLRIVSGASTISQQLVKIAIISPKEPKSQNLFRKLREILIAIRLNLSYSKKDILEKYLNEIYYGNLAYGTQAASQLYFNKDVSQLSLAESAFLAGLVSAPEVKNPYKNFNKAKLAQERVLELMVKNNLITRNLAEEAKKEVINLNSPSFDIKAPHFVHYILDEVKKKNVKTKEGINIYTTLDYFSFRLSEDIAQLWVNKLKKKHNLSNTALVLIKNDTGEILVMLGGIDYFDQKNEGQVNMTLSLRQPGSTLKPITYAAAFMQGYTPATLIYDIKKTYKTKKGEGFTPNNYDGRHHGLVLAREALASSLNIPAVEMMSRIGIKNFLKVAQNLGITTLSQAERYDLSLTLGGGEVRLLDLTNVYASFARGGIYKEPYAIEKIITDSGKTLYRHKKISGIPALGKNSKEIAYLITDILSDNKARLLGFNEKNPLVLSHPAAVKTGTTTDWHDNWTIGYTPDYTVGVWVGNNDNRPMKRITGIVGAAPIWNQFFEEYLKGKPKNQFSRPEKIKEVEICKITGQLPDKICSQKITEIFIEGTEPKEKTSMLKKVKIDKRNGLLASKDCQKEFVEEKVLIDYPPEVYSWAIENNQITIPRQFSPLCKDDKTSISLNKKPFLSIIYPREGAVFQTAPLMVANEAIVFEINASSIFSQIHWYIDNQRYQTINKPPFSISWKPKIGKHSVFAIGETKEKQIFKTEKIHFSVIEFNEEKY